MQYHILDII